MLLLIDSLVAETKRAWDGVPHVIHGIVAQTEAQHQSAPEVEWMTPPVHPFPAAALRRPLGKVLRLETQIWMPASGRQQEAH